MINAIPILGWVLSAIFAVGLAVPFWFFWTFCRLGEQYFYFVPDLYQSVPFWDCVGLFIVVSILKSTFTPNFASVSQTSNKGTDD